MNNLSGRLVVYLVGMASIFVILFGIRGSASIINPILLATVITITVLPIPSRLTKRGMPGWLAMVLSILMVVLLLGLVYLPWGLIAVGAGAMVMMWGLFGWSMEPLTREDHG